MKSSEIKTVETSVNPFGRMSRLPVVKRDGTVGYVRVSSRGGDNDKQYEDGKAVNGPAETADRLADAEQTRRSNSY